MKNKTRNLSILGLAIGMPLFAMTLSANAQDTESFGEYTPFKGSGGNNANPDVDQSTGYVSQFANSPDSPICAGQAITIPKLAGVCKWPSGIVSCSIYAVVDSKGIGAYFTYEDNCDAITSQFSATAMATLWIGKAVLAPADVVNFNIICTESHPTIQTLSAAMNINAVLTVSATCPT